MGYLVVIFDTNLTWTQQKGASVMKNNRILGMLSSTFISREAGIRKQLGIHQWSDSTLNMHSKSGHLSFSVGFGMDQ